MADVQARARGRDVEPEPGRPLHDQRPLEADREDRVGDDAAIRQQVEERGAEVLDARRVGP